MKPTEHNGFSSICQGFSLSLRLLSVNQQPSISGYFRVQILKQLTLRMAFEIARFRAHTEHGSVQLQNEWGPRHEAATRERRSRDRCGKMSLRGFGRREFQARCERTRGLSQSPIVD